MGFFSSYGKTKAEDLRNSIVGVLANWDPEGASEAEIDEMNDKLVQVSEQCAKAKNAMVKEKNEADAIVKLYNQRVDAANLLKSQVDAETDTTAKASKEKSLNTLLDTLEKMAPDVEREKQEAVDAEDFFKYLEGITISAAEKLKTARSEYNDAIRSMAKAKITEQMANDKEQASRIASGLEKNDFGTAMGAIKKITEDANARAEAAKNRADLLKPVSVEEDANVKAALEAVSGKATPTNVGDRLAALKKM